MTITDGLMISIAGISAMGQRWLRVDYRFLVSGQRLTDCLVPLITLITHNQARLTAMTVKVMACGVRPRSRSLSGQEPMCATQLKLHKALQPASKTSPSPLKSIHHKKQFLTTKSPASNTVVCKKYCQFVFANRVMMETFFTRITEANKDELYLPNRHDRVYYTELNEWYTTGAFRNFSLKIVLDQQIHYRVGRREIAVTAGKCLLAQQQPEVKAYYSSRQTVKSICVDIDSDTIAEVYTVLRTKEPCLDNYIDHQFDCPDFAEDSFYYSNSSLGLRIGKLANNIKAGSEIQLNREWFYAICEEAVYRQYGKYIAYTNLSYTKAATRREILRRLETAMNYIEANFLWITSMHEVAAIACMSDYHFLRCFRIAYKITPYQYVLQKRLTYAQSLMKQLPEAGLKKIAALCGFPDMATFSKAYKRCFKATPSMYRRSD